MGSKRMLLVDDERDILAIIEELALESVGEDIEVITCFDGLAAKQVLTNEKFDLLMTDLSMPKMDGLELLKFVRGKPSLAEMPVIMHSAFLPKMDGTYSTSLLENVYFIAKPGDFSKFHRLFTLLLCS